MYFNNDLGGAAVVDATRFALAVATLGPHGEPDAGAGTPGLSLRMRGPTHQRGADASAARDAGSLLGA
ncbi:hypothetical protein [Streptomyces sp. CB01635]|uniref:hypothetical protein n=1 Tax=Streptomyces sp. CB01635 TaxID=2020326 RepID=UPI0026D75D50